MSPKSVFLPPTPSLTSCLSQRLLSLRLRRRLSIFCSLRLSLSLSLTHTRRCRTLLKIEFSLLFFFPTFFSTPRGFRQKKKVRKFLRAEGRRRRGKIGEARDGGKRKEERPNQVEKKRREEGKQEGWKRRGKKSSFSKKKEVGSHG